VPTFSQECLDGKHILITGGLGAIGQVVVARLLAHSGRVVVNDILAEEVAARIIRNAHWPEGRCVYVRADVTQAAEAKALVERAWGTFGRLDAVLCHAGLVEPAPILETTEQQWDVTQGLNLKAAFLVAQSAAQAMVKHDVKGKILFTTSWVQDVPWPGIAAYCVSKSGLKTLMRGMARELAPLGIRVNAVAPGIVAVGMAKRQWDADPEYRARAAKAIPLGFLQPPESVADAIVFLCSGVAEYMTGATLLVDGGCSLYPMD
jgi:NAD(P)-dependent dehydrogenase (short-subunit alcohol dehydrogenase family)